MSTSPSTPPPGSSAMPKPQPDPGRGRAPDDPAPREKRWSAGRKSDLVIRLLKGESLDALSRETHLPASRIAGWRDSFLAAGASSLKAHASEPAAMTEEARRDMQAKVGELTMENELLRGKIAHLEAGLPPALRRSKR